MILHHYNHYPNSHDTIYIPIIHNLILKSKKLNQQIVSIKTSIILYLNNTMAIKKLNLASHSLKYLTKLYVDHTRKLITKKTRT